MTESLQQEPYRVTLGVFEGPLDLLLHLIRQQELDIYDIPIARITDQYLHYLKMMKNLNITVAGEFLVMAANLIYIKSRMLVPQPENFAQDEEIEDPRLELVQQLLEREKFQKAADLLHDRQVLSDSVWTRGGNEFEDQEKEAVSAGVYDLIQAFHSLVEKYRENIGFRLESETVTLEQRLLDLRKLLNLQGEIFFSFFLKKQVTRLYLVVTFLALLEMARLGEIHLVQEELFQDIRIIRC